MALQASMTSTFDFADFTSADGGVRVARPVAVAETAGGADDTVADRARAPERRGQPVARFYRVDDLAGSIGGCIRATRAMTRRRKRAAYQLSTGGTALSGPGYGNYEQAGLLDVDAGKIISMKLVNNTTGAHYWAFAQANETVNGQSVGHLWNYGLNTWGWEDTFGGGDRDFNDLIVQLDFTSASGHGWLI
jgi:hypothetical protein